MFRVSKHFVSSVSLALCLAFGWMGMLDGGIHVWCFDGWDGWGGHLPVGVFFSGKNDIFEDLMQQDQLSRKADLLVEWGVVFFIFCLIGNW